MTTQIQVEIEYTLGWSDWIAFYTYIEGKDTATRSRWRLFGTLFYQVLLLSAAALALLAGLSLGIYFLLKFLFWVLSVPDSPWALVGTAISNGVALVAFAVASKRAYQLQSTSMHSRKIRRWVDVWVKSGALPIGGIFRVSINGSCLVVEEKVHEIRDGVESLEHKESRYSDKAISAFDVVEHHAFIIVNDKEYTIIPAKAFASQQAFLEFVEKVRRLCAGGSEPVPQLDPTCRVLASRL